MLAVVDCTADVLVCKFSSHNKKLPFVDDTTFAVKRCHNSILRKDSFIPVRKLNLQFFLRSVGVEKNGQPVFCDKDICKDYNALNNCYANIKD